MMKRIMTHNILRSILMAAVLLMLTILFYVKMQGFRFSSTGAGIIWIILLAFSFTMLILSLKGTFRTISIISMFVCVITTVVLYRDIAASSQESVRIHHLKNDERVAITYFLSGGAYIKATRFLAKTFCADFFYKRIGKEYTMDPDMGDLNLLRC